MFFFFFSSRRRHTRYIGDWSSDVCSSDLTLLYLMSTQEEDGHWLQNMWLDGSPYWGGVQMDETAFRSEERRVGKECRSRWGADECRKTKIRIEVKIDEQDESR